MSTFWLPLALMLTASAAAPADRITFWLDARLADREQVDVIFSAMERMAKGSDRLERATHREEADVLVRLRLGARRTEREETAPTSDFGPEAAEPENAITASTSIQLDFDVVDVLRGERVLEQRARCRLPLTSGRRVVDPALRAHLSDVVQRIDDWAKQQPLDRSSPAEFAPELAGLDGVSRARVLFREAVEASRAGYREAALNLLAEAQPAFKEAGLRREEGRAWEWLAGLMAATGRPLDRSISYAKQAVRIAREVSDRNAETRALMLLGVLEARNRNYPRALELLQVARRQGPELGVPLMEAVALADSAGLAAMRGQFENARTMQAQALVLAERSGHPRAEGRLRLAMVVTSSHTDVRARAATLAQLDAIVELARQAGDRALEEDAAFVQAGVRLGTKDYGQLLAGEIDAMRALKLSRLLDDRQGETAAFALLGAFAHRLEQPERAAEYLAIAQEKARERGDVEILADTLQLLGEMAPSYERGLSLLDSVLQIRRETGDRRQEIKTLSDMVRLHAGIGENEAAWERYQEAAEALGRYVEDRNADPYAEDIQESLLTVLKSLVATRTELPFLEGYLERQPLLVIPDPSWFQGG